jgi:WD40 repeat protein
MKLWDTTTGDLIQTYTGHSRRVVGVMFATDGETLYSGSDDDTLRIWNMQSGGAIQQFEIGIVDNTRTVMGVTFSSDGENALVGLTDGTAALWNIASQRPIAQFQMGAETLDDRDRPITALFFSANNRSAFVGNRGGNVVQIQTLPLDELVQWTYANRYVPELDCATRVAFNVGPFCDQDGVFPTRTPFAPN